MYILVHPEYIFHPLSMADKYKKRESVFRTPLCTTT